MVSGCFSKHYDQDRLRTKIQGDFFLHPLNFENTHFRISATRFRSLSYLFSSCSSFRPFRHSLCKLMELLSWNRNTVSTRPRSWWDPRGFHTSWIACGLPYGYIQWKKRLALNKVAHDTENLASRQVEQEPSKIRAINLTPPRSGVLSFVSP